MKGKRWNWTEEKNQLLRDLWPTMGNTRVARMLGCSRSCVRMQAVKLGLGTPRGLFEKWPQEDADKLRELWPKMSCALIGLEIGRSGKSVLWKARRMGLPRRSPEMRRMVPRLSDERWWRKDDIERLRRLRLAGWSYRAIATELGVTRSAVAGHVRRLGLINTRPLSDNPQTVERRNRDRRLRSRMRPITELTVDLPPDFRGPITCQYVYGNPLRFCTEKRMVLPGGIVSMYCKRHMIAVQSPKPRHMELRE